MTQEPVSCPGLEACPHQDRASRPLYWLLGLTGGLLLASGLLSAWAVKRVEGNYSELIASTAGNLNQVQDIALHAGIGYAAALELPFAVGQARQAELAQNLARHRAANDKAFAELARTVSDSEFRSALNDALAKRKVYGDSIEAFLKSAGRPSASRTELLSNGQVFQAFVEYQTACDRLSDLIIADSVRANDQATRDIAKFRWLFLGTSIFPLAVGLALIMLTLYAAWTSPAELDLHG